MNKKTKSIKPSESSPRGLRNGGKKAVTTKWYDLSEPPPITPEQDRQLRAAFKRGVQPEDLEEIPLLTKERVRNVTARYRRNAAPEQRELNIRVDADVFDCATQLRAGELQQLLRKAMHAAQKR